MPVSTTPGENPLRVRRPKGNTRGPLPGQGDTNGLGVPDVADRTSQGLSTQADIIKAQGVQSSEQEGGSGIRGGAVGRPTVATGTGTTGNVSAEQQRAANEARARQAAIDRAAAASGGDDTVRDDSTPLGQPATPPLDIATELNTNTDPIITGAVNKIRNDTRDAAAASAIINPDTLEVAVGEDGQPVIQFPVDPETGERVFFGVDLFGNEGYGSFVTATDESGAVFTEFQLAGGEVQSKAQEVRAIVEYARNFFIDTDEATRAARFDTLSAQIQDFFNRRRDQEADVRAQRAAEIERQFTERLENTRHQNAIDRDERQRAFDAHLANLDRAERAARDSRDFALRNAEFDLAKQRFEQENMLNQAQFALTLFRSFSEAPEMIHMLQTTGLIESFRSILPGFNIDALIPGLVEGEQAASRLAQADLPSLAELQAMPADVRTEILISIAVRTGVRQETIVEEITRRASGQGIAGNDAALRRIPA